MFGLGGYTAFFRVHQNISITGNRLELQNTKPLRARSSSNLEFSDNTIKSKVPLNRNDLVDLENCEQVKISVNALDF